MRLTNRSNAITQEVNGAGTRLFAPGYKKQRIDVTQIDPLL